MFIGIRELEVEGKAKSEEEGQKDEEVSLIG
jgi:hypothetical protein